MVIRHFISCGYPTRQADQIWAMGRLLRLRDGAYLLYGSPAIVSYKNNPKRLKITNLKSEHFKLLYDSPAIVSSKDNLKRLKTIIKNNYYKLLFGSPAIVSSKN